MVAFTALNCKIPTVSPSSSHSNSEISSSFSRLPLRFRRAASYPSPAARRCGVSCTLTTQPSLAMEDKTQTQRPDSFGRFGRFGGKYVPETLMHALTQLEAAFHSLAGDQEFQVFDQFLLLSTAVPFSFWVLCLVW